MFRELIPHTLHGIIDVVGHQPNKVSTISVEAKTSENGISPNILDIGIIIQYHTQVHKPLFPFS
jgi:hypothetical protein